MTDIIHTLCGKNRYSSSSLHNQHLLPPDNLLFAIAPDMDIMILGKTKQNMVK